MWVLVVEANPVRFRERHVAAIETTHMRPGLPLVRGKPIVARFDGELMSSDGGLLALREVEFRLGIARRLAACFHDRRASGRIPAVLGSISAARC